MKLWYHNFTETVLKFGITQCYTNINKEIIKHVFQGIVSLEKKFSGEIINLLVKLKKTKRIFLIIDK